MKDATANKPTLRASLRTASRAARRKAFRKGLPIAVSKNGKVVFVYKDNREVIIHSPSVVKSK